MEERSPGIIALSLFFGFGAVMAGLTGAALLFPTGLQVIWRLKPDAHARFLTIGVWAIPLMTVVAVACALSAYGLWVRARWGHRLAVVLLFVNIVGDAANAVIGGDLRTLIGLPIGAAMIAYLLTAGVRRQFRPQDVNSREHWLHDR